MSGRIRSESAAPFATVTLCNPGKRNALTVAMWQELRAAFEKLGADEALSCILIRGEGSEAFAAGADISEFDQARSSLEQVTNYHEELVAPALDAIANCDVPVVAAICGTCIGGGLEIASVCDLRLSAASARFGIPVGLLGFPMAYRELEYLVRMAGFGVMAELLLENRIFDAEEAGRKGIATRVVADEALDEEVRSAMQRVARGSPLAARIHKRQLRRLARNASSPTLEERTAIYQFANSQDYRIGREAFLAKAAPAFVGR